MVDVNTLVRVQGPVSVSQGTGYKIDPDSISSNVTPENASYASALNSSSECGATDWANGTAKSIFGQNCNIFDDDTGTETTYDLALIDTSFDPDRLYFPDDSTGNGATEGTRPTDVDTSFYLEKCAQADCGN